MIILIQEALQTLPTRENIKVPLSYAMTIVSTIEAHNLSIDVKYILRLLDMLHLSPDTKEQRCPIYTEFNQLIPTGKAL